MGAGTDQAGPHSASGRRPDTLARWYLGAIVLSAFPALIPHHHGAHTVLTGFLDQSALYGVLAEVEALGLDLLELRKLTPDRDLPQSGTAAN